MVRAPAVFLLILLATGALARPAGVIAGKPAVTGAPPPVDKSRLHQWDDTPLTRSLDGIPQLIALGEAYPDRIGPVTFRHGDWAVEVNGTWIYWANGRLLPAKARHEWHRFSRHHFYRYTTGPLTVAELSAEARQRLKEYRSYIDTVPPHRHNGFAAALYNIRTAEEARAAMVSVPLLGFSVRVHPMIAEKITSIDREITARAAKNGELQRFIAGLASVEGFFWRRIAGTQTRSNHAYGIAVDLLPRSYFGRSAYWQWSEQAGINEWWDIPVERRWLVPMDIIEVFEEHHFVWGGRWLFFDNLHFEYRPELFLADALWN